MSCPFAGRRRIPELADKNSTSNEDEDPDQIGFNALHSEKQITYGSFLQLDKILSAQSLSSSLGGTQTPVHDEHLFIITHQAFELWFKQILFDIDSIREILDVDYVEERNQLTVIRRLNRIAEILKLLCSQFLIIETMTPQDFLELRQFLANSSGFQSFQFRMMEVKLGLREELRVLYNKTHFMEVFFGEDRKLLEKTAEEKSLFQCINDWLERTPGLEESGFNFFGKFQASVNGMLDQERSEAIECPFPEDRKMMMDAVAKRRETFQSLFNKQAHDDLVRKGQRRFSHRAMQGALMVFLYRDEPRCHLPFQLLQCLMDIDSQFTKLRYNHTCMVQRMIGGKVGTGGSSGYFYLRSTCSDRYKVFLDLLNLSTFLVPRDRIPPLTSTLKRSLSISDWIDKSSSPFFSKPTNSEIEEDSGILSSIVKGMRRFSRSSLGNSEKWGESFKEDDPTSSPEFTLDI